MSENEFDKSGELPVVEADRLEICFDLALVNRLRKNLPSGDTVEKLRDLFALLADVNRIKILHAMHSGGELCVNAVAELLGTSASVASHHLRKMRSAGVLASRTEGKMGYYSVKNKFAAELVNDLLVRVSS